MGIYVHTYICMYMGYLRIYIHTYVKGAPRVDEPAVLHACSRDTHAICRGAQRDTLDAQRNALDECRVTLTLSSSVLSARFPSKKNIVTLSRPFLITV